MICKVDINNLQVNIKIRQVDMIWQVDIIVRKEEFLVIMSTW